MKNIAILGSTGSIGTQTLDVVRESSDFRVVGMTCNSNILLFAKQIREFNPLIVSVGNEELKNELEKEIQDLDVEINWGLDGLVRVATMEESETLVTAIVGMIGLIPTIEAIKNKKDIALANKETLVTAGHIIMPLAKENNVSILPVDSEHSAIFQSLQGNSGNKISKILLTCSGGPFRGRNREYLKEVKKEDALNHPNWDMGKKITIDSATLINKGLEVMEAKWLFDVDLDDIEVVVHPESVIHSAVMYEDGAVMAELGTPDMRLPIQYALTYPKRMPLSGERLDLFKLKTLNFMEADEETFTGLKMAKEAMRKGGNMPTIFNAANECAVSLFLHDKISFLEIMDVIWDAMNNIKYVENAKLEDVLDAEINTREYIRDRWEN